MAKYKALIITLIIVAAIGGVVFYALTEFPGLIPSHTIPQH